ncbi:MAG: hypothetical protein WBG32_19415, partial [Nodosilinea sp.]
MGFDTVKEVITSEVNIISEKRFREGKQSFQSEERIKNGLELRASWEKYYLFRLESSGLPVGKVRMINFSESIRNDKDISLDQFRKDLEDSFNRRRKRTELRCSIYRFPDEFWRNIATASALNLVHLENWSFQGSGTKLKEARFTVHAFYAYSQDSSVAANPR